MKKAVVVLLLGLLILPCGANRVYGEEPPNVELSTWVNGVKYTAQVYYYRADGTQCGSPLCEGVTLVVTIYLEDGEVVQVDKQEPAG